MGNNSDDRDALGVGNVLKGLGKLIDVVTDLVDSDMSKKTISGDLFKSREDRGLKGRYDFTVKMGLNDRDAEQIAIKPEVVIPQTDIFKENDGMLIILEMPDITPDKFYYSINERFLYVEGIGKRAIYRKEVEGGEDISKDDISIKEKNGIFTITLKYRNKE